jgi:hypothetical protein
VDKGDAEENKHTIIWERDCVLAAAYISVVIQVIMDDSTMIRAAYDTLEDRIKRPEILFRVSQSRTSLMYVHKTDQILRTVTYVNAVFSAKTSHGQANTIPVYKTSPASHASSPWYMGMKGDLSVAAVIPIPIVCSCSRVSSGQNLVSKRTRAKQ